MGTIGATGIITSEELDDVHPEEFVTVKLYVPGYIPVIVVVVPVPEVVMDPGLRVRVQVPDAGSPFIITLPVATVQVGAVIVPIAGAEGVAGWVFITMFADDADVQPAAVVTVYV